MCGIIAVLRRPSDRTPPSRTEILGLLEPVPGLLGTDHDSLTRAVTALAEADRLLRGTPGVTALIHERDLPQQVAESIRSATEALSALEARLDEGEPPPDVEALNAAIVRVKDLLWAIPNDRLNAAAGVQRLGPAYPDPHVVDAYLSIHQALTAVDRLEVRGRDSAGLLVLVDGHDLDQTDGSIRDRTRDPLFGSGSVRVAGDRLVFVYKAAAEIGDLGDNTAALRNQVAADDSLREALRSPTARALVLGHTRWASVGIISQANAHPLDSAETEVSFDRPFVAGVLNGDVDNHADLSADAGLRIAAEITTDAKVIPTLTARRIAAGDDPTEAFRATVASLDGSVAVAATVADRPEHLYLALRGSGQALYAGLADDAFIVASEPYGLVEETDAYLRMDGEAGEILVLDADAAGTLAGIERLGYDGSARTVTEADVRTAEITTRDIDRAGYAHYLLKEINESPASFRKTLRGKLVDVDGELTVRLGADVIPDDLRRRLGDGSIRRIVVIGQGTAAVAGQGLAAALQACTADAALDVDCTLATELSGFGLRADMADTLVIAISQSGTTTDTNRTVDLARSRGATVVAIVNRRSSDLTDRADGVLYTSDGRDVEMAVPSTKAFYSQIAAGLLLAVGIADAVGVVVPDRAGLLAALRGLPDAMSATLDVRGAAHEAARLEAPARRYWAIVGNGMNRIAAAEIRIKLSELCYKSIACDGTEDKKHIDLSAEPLIVVCAAGLSGSTADDVAKEVAIYRAHKATPIVIATEGEGRFAAAQHVLAVPPTDPRLAFVLTAMAGHLFGYEAALAIDAQAVPLREARAAVELLVGSPQNGDLLDRLAPSVRAPASRFFDGLRAGAYDGHLEASAAVRLASLLRYALRTAPLDAYQVEYGKVGTPSVVVEDLTAALTEGIEQLTRPVDAIKHQAKTVTVGISRSDEALLHVPLVAASLDAGAPRDRLSYRTLRTLAEMDLAIAEVVGYTRYRIEGDPSADDDASLVVLDKGGVATGIPSRAERDPRLRGTKHRVAVERSVYVTRGRHDGRTVLVVPEIKDGQSTGLTLLHVRLADRLAPAGARRVLEGYRDRYAALKDAVTETEPTFHEEHLADVSVLDLLTLPIADLADRWRT